MASINKVILIGNLGQDPEARAMPNGTQVAKFSLATNEKWKDKATGQTQTKTEWHNVVMYRQLDEIATSILKKGMTVYVEGSLNTNKWTDKEGKERTTTSVVASVMQALSSKDEGEVKPVQSGLPYKFTNVCKSKNDAELSDDDLPF